MATIVTRAGKGSPLTNTEVDANFTNLNTDKIETVPVASASTSGTVKIGAGVTIDAAGVLTSTGATNLSNTPAATNVAMESSTGTNTTLPAATTSAAGVLSAADKTKLDGGAASGLHADLLDGQHGSYYTGYADTAVSNLVDSSPAALNTLNELAAALGDDANFSTTITDSVATKLPKAGGAMTGAITTNSTFDGRDVATDGTKLDTVATNANNYAHPTGNGNQHIPADGATGKYLKYASAGTAQWGDNELAVANFEYTATANQTAFSGSDNNSATLAYTVGGIIVSLNGIILDSGSDYTGSNGTLITLATGAAVGDHFAVIAFSPFSTSDTVSATSGGTFGAGVTVNGNVTANGSITVTGTVDGRDLQTDGTKLDGVATSANNYVHPTTNGNKHVPAGGATGQLLQYASAGTAAWQTVQGSDSRQNFIADGALTPRSAVYMTAAGKVTNTVGYRLRATGDPFPSGTYSASGTGSAFGGNAVHYQGNSGGWSCYSTAADKTVYIYRGKQMNENNSTAVIVGTQAANGTMSYGSIHYPFPNRLVTNLSIKYIASTDKFVMVFGDSNVSSTPANPRLMVAVASLSGTTLTVGTPVSHKTYGSLSQSPVYMNRATARGGVALAFDVKTDGSGGVCSVTAVSSFNSGTAKPNCFGFSISGNSVSVSTTAIELNYTAGAGQGNLTNTHGGSGVHWHNPTSQFICTQTEGTTRPYWLVTLSGSTAAQVGSAAKVIIDPRVVPAAGVGNLSYHPPRFTTIDNTTVAAVTFSGSGAFMQKFTIGSGTLSGGTGNNMKYLAAPISPSAFHNVEWVGTTLYACDMTNVAILKWVGGATIGEVNLAKAIAYETTVVFPLVVPSFNVDLQTFSGVGTSVYGAGNGDIIDASWSLYAGGNGSESVQIGIHDSASAASDGATVVIALAGSLVTGFSNLLVGLPSLGGTAMSASTIYLGNSLE